VDSCSCRCACVCYQQDLLTEDVFLLDAYDNVYVWLGSDARHDEKTMAMDAALVTSAICLSVCLSVCVGRVNRAMND